MFIETKKYFMTGNGSLDCRDIKINTSEISSAVECGFEDRPFNDLLKVLMKNGEKLYLSLRLKDL